MMRRSPWILGMLLILPLVAAPPARANDRYSEARYYPSERTMRERTFAPGMPTFPGARVYHVVDDPNYDLSGPKDTKYLVGDGSSYRSNENHGQAAFAATGMAPRRVAAVPAEYRQNWMAVAAGDRPVRCVAAPGAMLSAASMADVPTERPVFTRAMYHERYENGPAPARMTARRTYHRHHVTATQASYTRTATTQRRHAHRHVYHRHTTAVAASYQPVHRRTWATTAAYEPPQAMTAEENIQFGRNLYQENDSWYMEGDDGWYRSDSWRGPFVHIKKGAVPREVIQSSKAPHHGHLLAEDDATD